MCLHELSILLFIGLFMKNMTFILQRKAGGQENNDDDFGVEGEIASHDNKNNNNDDGNYGVSDNQGDGDDDLFQIANEEEEATFCLEHGMEYARENPQKVKTPFHTFCRK